MHPLLLVSIGVAIVLCGVLFFRLHAFLALLLAALTVALLTPAAQLREGAMPKDPARIAESSTAGAMTVAPPESESWPIGAQVVVLRREEGAWREIASARVTGREEESRLRLSPVEGENEPRPGDAVLPAAEWDRVLQAGSRSAGERVARSFGNTCASIGILIALAAIIGRCLLDSGAADRIVHGGLSLVGERGAPAAFVGSGFLLGIPVFFDTVFYLMIPLGKALARRTGRNYLLYVMTIVAGATMAHSLVPPTPGPLFVAEQLNVNLGKMVLAGCAVGIVTSSCGYFYAVLISRLFSVPVRDAAAAATSAAGESEAPAAPNLRELPPLWLALLPILLPVLLIGGQTLIQPYTSQWPEMLRFLLRTLGEKNTALALAAAVALGTLAWRKGSSLRSLGPAISSALESGGVILLITAAGGAFGAALQQSGITEMISEIPRQSHLVTITLAFLITTAVRTAQGSATVAMITTVGLLAGLVPQLGCDPVYLALAIGCGSKPLSWMNDSGFWVICKMSGMSEGEALRFITPLTLMMGLAGLAVTLLAAWLWPHP